MSSLNQVYFSILLNAAIILMMGVVGWLLRRAIADQDETIKQGIGKVEKVDAAVQHLQILIVGDYYPRKEHQAFADQLSHTLDGMRNNIHNLRDSFQSLSSKLSVIEALLQKGKSNDT